MKESLGRLFVVAKASSNLWGTYCIKICRNICHWHFVSTMATYLCISREVLTKCHKTISPPTTHFRFLFSSTSAIIYCSKWHLLYFNLLYYYTFYEFSYSKYMHYELLLYYPRRLLVFPQFVSFILSINASALITLPLLIIITYFRSRCTNYLSQQVWPCQ